MSTMNLTFDGREALVGMARGRAVGLPSRPRMSDLYAIRVAARPDDRTVDLDVKVVHPDAMHIPATPGFALMLLHDQASGDAPLAAELDLATVMDAGWASSHARAFVESVELLSSKNEPPPEAIDDYEHRYWQNSKRWLEGRLRIRATHPAWVRHLPSAWDSAAFDPAGHYEACDAALPDAVVEVTVERELAGSTGFLPLPRLSFVPEIDAEGPEVIWVASHGPRAYEASERLTGVAITPARLVAWLGSPVVFADASGRVSVATLTRVDAEALTLTTLTRGGRMIERRSPESLAWIGPAAYRRGTPRLAPPLTIESRLEYASPVASCVRVEGDTATLQVFELARSGEPPRLDTHADVLRLIAGPARADHGDFEGASTKLGKALHHLMVERELGWHTEIYPRVAEGLIASFEVEPPTGPRELDLDALPRPDALAFFTGRRWPTWTVRVVVHDPAWLEHLADAPAWAFDTEALDEPQAWDDAPITWDEARFEAQDEDDDEDEDDEDEEVDEPPVRSTQRRRFALAGPITRMPAGDPDDPRVILREQGLWDEVGHTLARDHFHDACKTGNLAAVRAYVALGIDREWPADISLETPLIRAAEGNQPEVVRILAAAGVDLQRRDSGGDTAIQTALNWSAPAALQALLEVGADPDAPDNHANYPLVSALSERQDMVEALLAGGASPNAGAGTRDSALQWCLREHEVDRLRALLDHPGADPNSATAAGDTLLHLAAREADDEALDALLEAGADPQRTNRWGWNPLDVALAGGATAIVERLERAGAKPSQTAAIRWFEAIEAGEREAIEAALAEGLAIDTRDAQGKTATMIAVANDDEALVEWLLARGADVDARLDVDDLLRQAGSNAMRRRLLAAGCSASFRADDGRLRQPGVEAVLEDDDPELLELLLGPKVRNRDLSDLSICNLSLIWGSYEDRLEARAHTLRRLGAAGADLDARADDGSPLFHGYISRGYVAPVLALIAAGADLEGANRNHVTPLLECCGGYSNHDENAEIAGALLDAGASLEPSEWLGRSAWDLAQNVGNQAIVALLEARFEQPLRELLDARGLADAAPESFDAALFEALARTTSFEAFRHFVRAGIRAGEHAIVRGLLAAGFDPNPAPRNQHGLRPGSLPLVSAVEAGDAAMVEVLLGGARPADPNLVQVYGSTALGYAVSEQRADIVELLLAAGADPQPFDDWGDTPLRSAAAHGDLALLERLVAAGASVQPLATGRHPLHAAARGGHFEAVEWLLARGADIDAREAGRMTALHVAIEQDQVEIALALIHAGAAPDLQTTDEHRHTPLISATKKGQVEVVEALLAAGADPQLRDAEGQSAIDHASYRDELRVLFPATGEARTFARVERRLPALLRAVLCGDREAFVVALADEGAGVVNDRGDTALMLATGLGRPDLVDALLDAGADVKATNAKGDSAWCYAFVAGQEGLRQRFEQLGAALDMDALNQMASLALRRDAAIAAIEAGDLARVAKQIDALELDVDFLVGRAPPLRLAIDRRDAALIQLLLAKGADPSLAAGEGRSLREYGEAAGFEV